MAEFLKQELIWTRKPERVFMDETKVEIITECSTDGVNFKQMRICHMWEGAGEITFGIYACSPENSSFKATFTEMEITECQWEAHK